MFMVLKKLVLSRDCYKEETIVTLDIFFFSLQVHFNELEALFCFVRGVLDQWVQSRIL